MEKWIDWVKGYPGWGTELLQVDCTKPQPGNAGLFSKGLEELSRREDVLGNTAVRYRWTVELIRVTVRDHETAAKWMVDFQNWVNAQSAPGFGDEPNRERVRAEKGKLTDAVSTGTLTYTVTLIAEFTRKYTEE